jgi:hypothetical protein
VLPEAANDLAGKPKPVATVYTVAGTVTAFNLSQ